MEAKVGRPLVPFSEAERVNFLAYVGEDLLLSNAARHIGATPQRVQNLMNRGQADIEADLNTEFAQIYREVRKKQAEKISHLLYRIEQCPKNWQALAWKLEKCFREDFGTDVELYKELLDNYRKLLDDMKRINDPINPQG